jgi:glycosyltransferase involved in cell wall biosynthesis
MNILLFSESHVSAYTGGNEIYFHSLAEELVKRGNLVTYVTLKGSENHDLPYRFRIFSGWRIGKFIFPKASFFAFLQKSKIEIVHAAGSGIGVYLIALWARFNNIPSVWTFQAPLSGKGFGSILRVVDEWITGRLFNHIIATSPKNALYAKKQMRSASFSTVLLALKPSFQLNARISRHEARSILGLHQTHTYVLFVATLDRHHYYKGLETSLYAVKMLPENYHLLVVGDGELRADYEKQAGELQISSRVHFVGKVEEASLPLYYQSADVVILPSTSDSEGFGLVLLEGMKAKRPVVTTSCVGIASLLKKMGIARVVAPKDHKALADAILQPILHKEQITDAYAFVKSRSVAVMASETEVIYLKELKRYGV